MTQWFSGKNQYMKKFIQIFASPPHFKGNIYQNRNGLQKRRILESQKKWLDTAFDTSGKYQEEKATLDRDGFLLKKGFFSDEIFLEIKREAKLFREGSHCNQYLNNNKSSVDWKTGYIPAKFYPTINDVFRHNDMVFSLVEYTTRRKILYPPETVYQELHLPRGKKDDRDWNRIIHADRFYPTIKVVLFLDDISEQDGPFMYAKGSHFMTDERIVFEEKNAYYNALIKSGRKNEVPSDWIIDGRIVPPPEMRATIKPEPILGEENTLAIVNTCGFHHRGELLPEKTRRCLRLIFHYLYAPLWSQRLFHLFGISPGRYLN